MALNLPKITHSLIQSALYFRRPLWNKCSAFESLLLFSSLRWHLEDGEVKVISGWQRKQVLQCQCSGPWTVLLLMFCSVSVHWPRSLLNVLVDVSDSVPFVRVLACPGDHSPAITFVLKVSTFSSLHFPTSGLFICLALGGGGKGRGWNYGIP